MSLWIDKNTTLIKILMEIKQLRCYDLNNGSIIRFIWCSIVFLMKMNTYISLAFLTCICNYSKNQMVFWVYHTHEEKWCFFLFFYQVGALFRFPGKIFKPSQNTDPRSYTLLPLYIWQFLLQLMVPFSYFSVLNLCSATKCLWKVWEVWKIANDHML